MNPNKNKLELPEFYFLGLIIFGMLFAMIAMKFNYPHDYFKTGKKHVSLPVKSVKSIYKLSNVSNIPDMTVVDDGGTPCNLQDDIINFSTAYYSLLLPYDLHYYTNRFGSNKSTKQLIVAMDHLYNQLLRHNKYSLPLHIDSYDRMLHYIKTLADHQDDIHEYLNLSEELRTEVDTEKITRKLDFIDPEKGKLPVLIDMRQQEIIYILSKLDSPSASEAMIIIPIINEHIFLMCNRTRIEFYQIIYNKGYNYADFSKPVIFNIVDRITKALEENKKYPSGQMLHY
jgi:hypothetical protein